jgi:hypothetical protein
LILLGGSRESEGWQQSCQRRDSSRDPHRSRVESVVNTNRKCLSSH